MKGVIFKIFLIIISFSFFDYILYFAKNKPNVLIFYMDDMGYGDLGCYGATGYSTPNIDKLAVEGIRFTNFLVAQPVCSASRAALLTGCYPNRLGLSGALFPHSTVGLNPKEMTIAKMLKQGGYKTALFGKWHLGDNPSFMPLNQGFDEYVGLPYSSDMWRTDYDGFTPVKDNDWRKKAFPPLYLLNGNKQVREIKNLNDQAELTKEFTKQTIRFIQENKNKPFFSYVAYTLPHVPVAASSAFLNKTERGLYGDMMQELDNSVGEILNALKTNGLDKNTIVILVSDNGPWINYGNHSGNTAGLKQGKGVTTEGGNRVPCIMRWPGVIPAGKIYNKLVVNMDILPTLAEACHVPLPKNEIDGVSILRVLIGNLENEPRKDFYYYYNKNNLEAVRRVNWKLVFEHPGRNYSTNELGRNGYPGKSDENYLYPKALYNLETDPGEMYDLQNQYPEKVEELEELASKARAELGDELTKTKGSKNREIGKVQ